MANTAIQAKCGDFPVDARPKRRAYGGALTCLPISDNSEAKGGQEALVEVPGLRARDGAAGKMGKC